MSLMKNTDQASAKLIRLKFNMLVLTIQDDLVGLYGYQKTKTKKKKKQKKKNNTKKTCFHFVQSNYLDFKPTKHNMVFWQKKQKWS